jgi:hypothetical protein
MKIVELELSKLKPYERNPRINDGSVEQVANSIKEFGFKVPIVIDSKNVIVTGHTRYKAANMLGLKTVPCVIADDLTEQQIKAFRLADNKAGENSMWDESLLELEMFDITDIDLSSFGFDLGEMVEEDRKEDEQKQRFEKMQLKAFEHYDYVVFVFNNTMDWLNIVNEFGIKKVDAGYGKTKKIGVGRVIDGKRLLEKIRNKDSDVEQRQV